MKAWLIALILFFYTISYGQEESDKFIQQLENETAGTDDREPEEDGVIQQREYYIRHRLNINIVDPDWMGQVIGLSKIQTLQFKTYRQWLGPFVDLMELQAIPGWDVETVRRVLPYLKLDRDQQVLPMLRERVNKGEHSFLFRTSRVLEKASGFMRNDSGVTIFTGDRQKLMLRYTYRFRNLLQWGITAEKDPGEPIFKKEFRKGFDYYSAHLAIREYRFIKTLVLGDYHINLGQGLIHWQSMAFRKSAETIQSLRQGLPLRAYNGTDENRFHRGAGIMLAKKNWSILLFYARDKLDGNIYIDSGLNTKRVFTSFQNSGLHRTISEIDDKDAIRQKVWGGLLGFNSGRFAVAVNGLQYGFSEFIKKQNEPYSLFSVTGQRWSNYSVDYGFTLKNVYFFGEAAMDQEKDPGFIQGILASLHPTIDISLVYRNISPAYRAFQSNAFTENSEAQNEHGLYSGISWRPAPGWRMDAYMDTYQFPWLAYRIDQPSEGFNQLLQVSWKPQKKAEMYIRFQREVKSLNRSFDQANLNSAIPYSRYGLRWHSSFQPLTVLTIKSRLDLNWYSQSSEKEQGFLTFIEILYKSIQKPYSFSGRMAWFKTDGYNSRMYSYERDVLYYYSIPAFFGSGMRVYFLFQQDIGKKWTVWGKVSSLLFIDNQSVGSGLTEISQNHRSEVRIQLLYRF